VEENTIRPGWISLEAVGQVVVWLALESWRKGYFTFLEEARDITKSLLNL